MIKITSIAPYKLDLKITIDYYLLFNISEVYGGYRSKEGLHLGAAIDGLFRFL